ncbi:conjugal transfer nickase/helicase domain-containing protein [Paracidovorax anthurii]|uniref:Putative conjugal transfer nickase/helicase TraI C-term n=1 Tax=Paracidovorax anthurii TaxID=78229 RepID=A0A328Z393_9BURK|nr:putative conjugal transfer nickase/helicase TraI C-term [Paracidovorax anthurii]
MLPPARPLGIDAEEAAYLIDESEFLDPMESAAALKRHQPQAAAAPAPAAPQAAIGGADAASLAPLGPPRHAGVSAEFRRLADELDELPEIMPRTMPAAPPSAPAPPEPVLLVQQLPRLGGDQGKPSPEPSELAIAFLRWVQQSLVSRELTYNEPGAAVHFVEQGMALVSPLIFRMYARDVGG